MQTNLAVHKSGSGLARAFLLEMWAALTCSKYGLASNETIKTAPDCTNMNPAHLLFACTLFVAAS